MIAVFQTDSNELGVPGFGRYNDGVCIGDPVSLLSSFVKIINW